MWVQESGSGEAVLLLHGTPSPASDFSPLAEVLAQRFRVLVPDLPGYGRSRTLPDTSIENVGDAIEAMLAERGVSRLHAVVGFSTGVYRAFDLVLRHGIPVTAMVALAGMVTFDDEARAVRRRFAELIEADPSFVDSDTLRETMRDMMLSPSWRAAHPDDERRVQSWAHLAAPAATAAELRSLSVARDLRPELRGFAAPVYARVGTADTGAPPAWSQTIMDAVPNGELELVPGVGHALLIEDRDGTIEAIARRL